MNPFRQVPMQVARNPVARAISKANLVNALRDFQIRLYQLNEGENVSGDVPAAESVLRVCVLAMQRAGHGDHPSVNVMRGAHSALVQCAARGFRWRKADVAAVDTGFQHAADLYPQLPAEALSWAWNTHKKAVAERHPAEAVPA